MQPIKLNKNALNSIQGAGFWSKVAGVVTGPPTAFIIAGESIVTGISPADTNSGKWWTGLFD